MKQLVSRDVVRAYLRYEPDTGLFWWKIRPAKPVDISKPAGSITVEGYVAIQLNGIKYKAHRLAHLIFVGGWPNEEMDHINGVRSDNRWENLRAVSKQVNQRNAKRRVDNLSGVVGVSKFERGWVAYINIDGKRKHLGYFATLEEATAARASANIDHNYHPNHGRSLQ